MNIIFPWLHQNLSSIIISIITAVISGIIVGFIFKGRTYLIRLPSGISVKYYDVRFLYRIKTDIRIMGHKQNPEVPEGAPYFIIETQDRTPIYVWHNDEIKLQKKKMRLEKKWQKHHKI